MWTCGFCGSPWFTQKSGFPLRGEFLQNADVDHATAFVTAVDATGTELAYSVRVGAIQGSAIAVGDDGAPVVVGNSAFEGRDFPVTPGVIQTVGLGLSDAVVFKIDPVADVAVSRVDRVRSPGGEFRLRITGELFLPGARVFIGSQSLRRTALDRRREIGVILNDAALATEVGTLFESDWRKTAPASAGDAAVA